MTTKNNNELHNDLPSRLSNPAQRALARAGIDKLSMLAGYSELEILAMHGIGPNAIKLLGQALASAGLAFKD